MKLKVPKLKFQLELEKPFVIELTKEDIVAMGTNFLRSVEAATGGPVPPGATKLPMLSRDELVAFASMISEKDVEQMIGDLQKVLAKKRGESEDKGR